LIFMDPSPRTAGHSAISPISTRIETKDRSRQG
jgi:hypothetical protein